MEKFFDTQDYRHIPGYNVLKSWWTKEESNNTLNYTIIIFSQNPLKFAQCYRSDIIYVGDGDFRMKTSYIFSLNDIQMGEKDKLLNEFKMEKMIWLSEYISKFYQRTKMIHPDQIIKWQEFNMRSGQLEAYIRFLKEKSIIKSLPLCSICQRPTTEGELDSNQSLCTPYCQSIYYDESLYSKKKLKEIFILNMDKSIKELQQKRHILYTDEQIQLSIQNLNTKNDNVPSEIHKKETQFIRVEKGELTVSIYLKKRFFVKKLVAHGDDTIIIPANKSHILENMSNEPVLFYSIYAPPAHTKEEMEQDYKNANRLLV